MRSDLADAFADALANTFADTYAEFGPFHGSRRLWSGRDACIPPVECD
jgi:hypothetical protein